MSLIKILPKKEVSEYFIALGVEEHRIIAAVAEIKQTHIKILGHGESEFREGENEIEAADIAISTAEKGLPENVYVRKVVFGLPPVFLEKDKVKPEYMGRLDKITRELDLEPEGFVEYPQALASYIERKEEASPTLLLLSIGRNHLILSHIRVGKVENNVIVPRTTSLNSDFENIISRFKSEILPNRIIIYDEVKGVQMEAIREELLDFSWHKFSSFLHTPKIEILEDHAVYTAMVEAAAGSMVKKFLPHSQDHQTISSQPEKKEEAAKPIPAIAETFGFTPAGIHKNQEMPASFSETVSNIREDLFPSSIQKETTESINEKRDDNIHKPKSSPQFPISIKFPHVSLKFLPITVFVLSSVILLGLIFSLIYYYPKASVNLIVYPQYSREQLNITFTTNPGKVNSDKKIILAKIISEEAIGDKTIPTTGTTNIGESSKGDVTIYNKTTAGKNFPKGTILTNGQLKFALDNDINIASASDTGEGLTFGKTNVSVTALEIGPSSNLTAGSIFVIKDFPQSSYYAKNNAALTGGTSREVASASKDDQNKLFTSLKNELETAVRQKIMQKITTGEKLIDTSFDTDIISQKFSKDVGMEAKEISLTLKIKINTYVYIESDLSTLISKDIFTSPQGFKIDNSRVQTKISQVKTEKNGDLSATAILTASFLPEIDISLIQSKISGKSYQDASSIVSTFGNIGGIEITKDNELPIFNDSLPGKKENIKIYIVPRI